MTKSHEDHHHIELNKIMQAAADNYSMATYHPHLFHTHPAPATRMKSVLAELDA